MKRVYLLSPFAGDIEKNIQYAQYAMLDCIKRDESPMVPHLLYTQVLDDDNIGDRETGMEAGAAWFESVNYAVCYEDLGISPGMLEELRALVRLNVPVVVRTIR